MSGFNRSISPLNKTFLLINKQKVFQTLDFPTQVQGFRASESLTFYILINMLIKTLTLLPSLLNPQHVERAPELCCGWTAGNLDTTVSTTTTFTVHAKERNGDRVQAIALDVSDPSSTNYANYLSSDTLDALTAPAPEDVATIRNWLSTFGDDVDVDVTRGRTFRVTVPTTKAEQVLSTTFRQVSNANTLQSTVRAGDYTIPQVVKDATDTIMGLHGLPLPPRASRATSPKSPAAVTPAVILSQYDVSGVAAKASSGNIQAVAEFQGQTMSSKDLTQFFQKYVPNAKPGDDKVSKFVGDPGDKTGQTEGNKLNIHRLVPPPPPAQPRHYFYFFYFFGTCTF